MKFRKKPVVVEAIQWTGYNADEMIAFMFTARTLRREDFESPNTSRMPGGMLVIETLEGDHKENPGDWIIKGVKGEFYPCKPDVFEATYEPVE